MSRDRALVALANVLSAFYSQHSRCPHDAKIRLACGHETSHLQRSLRRKVLPEGDIRG